MVSTTRDVGGGGVVGDGGVMLVLVLMLSQYLMAMVQSVVTKQAPITMEGKGKKTTRKH